MTAKASFSYDHIETGHEFRILVISPATDWTADLKCELIHTNFDDRIEYEALSYVWGSTSNPSTLQLHGRSVPITRNLDTALRYIRYPDKVRHVWVDALCIDQHNLDERNKHVRCMNEIYAHCSRDLLWMGPDSSLITEARQTILELGSLSKIARLARPRLSNDYNGEEPSDEQMQAICNLFQKPHAWKRVWIVQEIAFAPQALLVAGHEMMAWEEVENFLDAEGYIKRYGIPDAFHEPFSHSSYLTNWLRDSVTYPQILSHQRRALKHQVKGYSASLFDVLARFRFAEATDPRDMIYGLLGLSSNPLNLRSNYALPVREVYIDCARNIIDADQSLDLLTQGPWQLYGNKKRSPDLPSWVPDFAQPGRSRILFAQRSIYAAGSKSLGGSCKVLSSGALAIGGLKLDSLSEAAVDRGLGSPPYPPGAQRAIGWMPDALIQERIDAGNESLSEFLKAESKSRAPDSAQPTFQDYWRTLMMDCQRYPIRRLHKKDVPDVEATFEKWITTPFDDDRDIHIDFDVQELVQWIDWHFVVSKCGHYCMVPAALTKAGDELAILPGSKVPVILRPTGQDGNVTYIGPCYVHGLMDGEANDAKRDLVEPKCYELV